MGWRVITADGHVFSGGFDPRIIGLTLADLQRIPMTIAVASGASKAQAILGALRSGVINVLATDSDTARLVLEAAE
jgi:DNA-binding transcriptional regulator LsrR (DeoR family)